MANKKFKKGELVRFLGLDAVKGKPDANNSIRKLAKGDFGIYKNIYYGEPDMVVDRDMHVVYWQGLGETIGVYDAEIESVKGEDDVRGQRSEET